MCRLLACPPNFSRDKAIEILKNFEKTNTDGLGYCYVKDGEFQHKKWPTSLTKILEKDEAGFLDNMPHNGWTIVHLRAASHGGNRTVNTHPFFLNDWGMIHNGIMDGEAAIRELLEMSGTTFTGKTDSEVALHLLDKFGPRKFSKVVQNSGVFMGLKKNGELWVVKTSGCLEFKIIDGAYLMASEFDILKWSSREVKDGWFHFNNKGELMAKWEQPVVSYITDAEMNSYMYGNSDFNFDDDDKDVAKFKQQGYVFDNEIGTRQPYKPFVPDATALTNFRGTYKPAVVPSVVQTTMK